MATKLTDWVRARERSAGAAVEAAANDEAPAARRLRNVRATRRRARLDSGRLLFERGLVLAVSLGTWWALVNAGVLDQLIFSSPGAVWHYLTDALVTIELWSQVGYTTATTLAAFAISAVLGVGTGLVFVQSPRLRRIFDPYLVLANSLPRVALAPLLIAWLGIGVMSKLVLGVSVAYFVILVNTMAGADSIDSDWVRLSRSLGASRRKIFVNITLPASVPSIFAGLKLGLVYAMLAVVVGEMLGGSAGIGQQISYNSNTFQMDKVLGQLLVLAVITALLSTLVGVLERRLMRWRTY